MQRHLLHGKRANGLSRPNPLILKIAIFHNRIVGKTSQRSIPDQHERSRTMPALPQLIEEPSDAAKQEASPLPWIRLRTKTHDSVHRQDGGFFIHIGERYTHCRFDNPNSSLLKMAGS